MTPTTLINTLFLFSLLFIFYGCKGGTTAHSSEALTRLREQAAAHPENLQTQLALLKAELLWDGGDVHKMDEPLSRAFEVDPQNTEAHFLAALRHDAHGHFEQALDHNIAVLKNPTTSYTLLSLNNIVLLDQTTPGAGGTGYTAKVIPTLKLIVDAPDTNIHPMVRHAAGRLLLDLYKRQGKLEEAKAVLRSMGVPQEVRYVGAFGDRPLLAFDESFAPETDPTLKDEYRLPRSGKTLKRKTLAPLSDVISLSTADSNTAGVSYVEHTFELTEKQFTGIYFESPNTYSIFLDGEKILSDDRRYELKEQIRVVNKELQPGKHRLLIKVASRHPKPVFSLSLHKAGHFYDFEDSPQLGNVVTSNGEDISTSWELWLKSERQRNLSNSLGARNTLLGVIMKPQGRSAFLLTHASSVLLNDPLWNAQTIKDTAKPMLESAKAQDPDLWYPELQLTRMEAGEGRNKEALERLRAAKTRWPQVSHFTFDHIALLQGEHLEEEMDEQIKHARESHPESCRALRLALGRALSRSRYSEADRMTTAIMACDTRSTAKLELHLKRRQWDEAKTEVDRLMAYETSHDAWLKLDSHLSIARSMGDRAKEDALMAELRAIRPEASALVLAQADQIMVSGSGPRALSVLANAAIAYPESAEELWEAHLALGGTFPLQEYRKNGLEVVAAFEKKTAEPNFNDYEEAKVLVLDYTVQQYFKDGSMLELTHNIFKVQHEEAIDEAADVKLPSGAKLFTLRTIKDKEGVGIERLIEPDSIAGKESISMPDVKVGDYIEVEYATHFDPSSTFLGGFVGNRFYFQGYEVPYHFSQLTVIVPKEVELTMDPRGSAPTPVKRNQGDNTVFAWTVQESRPLKPEPSSVHSREFIPSVYFGHNATWEHTISSLREVLVDANITDEAHQRLMATVLGDEQDPEKKARVLYDWVLTNIEDANDAFGQASSMLAARTGHRARVLAYMLKLASIPSEMVLVRGFNDDATQGTVPDDSTYQNIVLRLTLGEGSETKVHWIAPIARGTPFGFIPPLLRGQDALGINAASTRYTLPAGTPEDDKKILHATLQMNEDGSAHAVIEEMYHGIGAINWRNQLEGIPPAILKQKFEEAYLSQILPGSALQSLVIEGQEGTAPTLTLKYEAEVEQVGRWMGQERTIGALFPSNLGAALASLPTRTTDMMVPAYLYTETQITVVAPSGKRFTRHPPEVTFSPATGASTGITYRLAQNTTTLNGRAVLHLTRTLVIPRSRIATTDYIAFGEFCKKVDQSEKEDLRIQR